MFPTFDQKHAWAVVLAGGNGTRLQQLTHRIAGDSRPKQFCELFGGKSLLHQTRERIAPLFPEDRTLFSLARAHEPFYRNQLAETHDRRKIVQPGNRGTAVAMALCLKRIADRDEDALVAFFPSDHHYRNGGAFREGIESGLSLMPDYPESILIVGAEARYPEVEYGWIQPGRTLVDSLTSPLSRVSRFCEKPTIRRARSLHRQGCLWNTFVTIGLVGAFLELLQSTVPGLMKSLDQVRDDRQLEQFYETTAPVDFSKAVLAHLPDRLVVLRDAASGWTDLGSPRRVLDVLRQQREAPPWLSPALALGAFQQG